MKAFMITAWLKHSGEGCFRRGDGEEFEDFKLAAFVLTIIRRVTKSEKKFVTIKIMFLNFPK